MDPLEKCTRVLGIAITEGRQASVMLAERAIDEYLQSFPDNHTKAGALGVLEGTLTKSWSTASGPRLDFVNVIYDYLEKQRLALQ
jgi:hypothetical protein